MRNLKYIVCMGCISTAFFPLANNANRDTNDYSLFIRSNDSTKTVSLQGQTDYAEAYEKALKRKEYLTLKRKMLNDSIKEWGKELKRLEGEHKSIKMSIEKQNDIAAQFKNEETQSKISSLQKKDEQLEKNIQKE